MNHVSLSRLLSAVNRLRILHADVHMRTYILYGTSPRHPNAIGVGWDGIEIWHDDAEIAIDRLICAVDGIREVERLRAQPEGGGE